ncbi:MAG: amphi-Trp domain-containing protein [Gammaproteobacteria bacterium]|jgi:amphi-Trp domain-containing protein|nr:amphi-Trp domain-containing protein [Gammaproteobacteria bacterium]
MKRGKLSFRHESLQDSKTIKGILKSLTDGLASGKLSFSDADDSIELRPKGLMNLKITASQEDNLNKVNIRITWQSEDKDKENKSLKVKSK